MQQVKFSDITTDHLLCIPGLPTVRIEIRDVGKVDNLWIINTVMGELSTSDPDRKVWAVVEKTALQWCEDYGIEIIDPDGWRLRNSPAKDVLLPEDEFYWRMGMSTIQVVDREKWLTYKRM